MDDLAQHDLNVMYQRRHLPFFKDSAHAVKSSYKISMIHLQLINLR